MNNLKLFCLILILPSAFQVFASNVQCRSVVIRNNSDLTTKSDYSSIPLMTRIYNWQKLLSELPKMGSRAQKAELLGDISDFAAFLISSHRNEDFYILAKHLIFPLNKKQYEDERNLFYYGSSLLETAILFKNHEIYKKLKDIPRLNGWPHEEVPMINRWNGPLAKAAMEDPLFSKDVLIIQRRGGPEFSPRIANYGKVTPKALQKFKDVSESKDILELNALLIDLFPSGTLWGKAVRKNGQRTNANLDFGHSGYEQKKNPFLHIDIRDSAEYHEGMFSWSSYYKVKMKFNLQLYDFRSNPSGFSGDYFPIEKGKKNWIREMTVDAKRIRILLERDKDGQFYDRDTKFQELTLHLSPDGRISQIQIRNGNNMFTRAFWKSQSIELAEQLSSFSNVYIYGEEDMSTTQMGK